MNSFLSLKKYLAENYELITSTDKTINYLELIFVTYIRLSLLRVCRLLLCYINALRPNSDLSQTSHYNIKGLLVREVMRIENMITQVKFSWYFRSFSPLRL